MWCVTQYDGRPIAEKEALKLSDLTSKVTSIVHRIYFIYRGIEISNELQCYIQKRESRVLPCSLNDGYCGGYDFFRLSERQ